MTLLRDCIAIAVYSAMFVASSFGAQPINNPLETQIVAAERAGLEALKVGDLKAFGDLTSDDAIFVDDHGRATKAQVLKNVANFKLLDYSMEDIHFVAISRQSGLISYKIKEKGSSHGHDFAA